MHAIIYARSYLDETTGDQFRRLRAYCEALGWPVLVEYVGEDLDHAVYHARQTPGAVLLVARSEVLGTLDAFLACVRAILKAKRDFVCLKDRVDTTIPEGRANLERWLEMAAKMPQPDRPQPKRVAVKRPRRVEFGFRWSGCALVEDDDEQETLARIRDLHAAGVSLRGICRQLDVEGRPRRGKTWANAWSLVRQIVGRGASSRPQPAAS